MLWYGLLADPWVRGLGLEANQLQNDAAPYVVAVVSTTILVVTLAWLIGRLNGYSAVKGMFVGFVVSFGFILPALLTHQAFGGTAVGIGYSAFTIDAGYDIVRCLGTGFILGVWKPKRTR
jgi:hypothetical protein